MDNKVMGRVIITASSKSMRAFLIVSNFVSDHLDFELSEIDLSLNSGAASPPRKLDDHFQEISSAINELIFSEDPGSWILAAPLSTMVHLLPLLDAPVRNRLADTKIGDLTELPINRIARRFTPSL